MCIRDRLYLYESEHLTQVEEPLDQDPDEFIEVVKLSYDQAWDLVDQGLINDSKTIFALYYWQLKLAKGD